MRRRQAFIRWAQDQWKSKPGRVHSLVKEQRPVDSDPLIGKDLVSDPSRRMTHKRKAWADLWSDPIDSKQDILVAMKELLAISRDDPLPPIQLE